MRIHNHPQTPAYLAHLLEAVAEPTRLRILNVLQAGNFCVCDLQAVLGLSEPMVSRHLARLRFAKLVTADREGARMVYRLNRADSPTELLLHRFLASVSKEESCLQRDPQILHDLRQESLPRRMVVKRMHNHHQIGR